MPTAIIDLAALSHNVRRLRSYLAPDTEILAAVKANAYGHGIVEVSRELRRLGISWFGVATADEALALKDLSARVLIFGPVYEGIETLLEDDIALTVVDEHSLACVSRAARKVGKRASIHLKVDTGMCRLGLPANQAIKVATTAAKTSVVELEGLWTHLARADEEDRSFTDCQLEAFGDLVAQLSRHGIEVPLKHAANSAGIIAYPEAHLDMVRPGIGLYGYHASPLIGRLEPRLKPIMTLTAPVTFVRSVGAGTPVSYGGLWQAPRDTAIATVRIGYADGYPRLLSNKAQVLVKGTLRPIVGRVCMDQLMVDVGELEVRPGDRVVLFGPQGPNAEDLAELYGTISYELLTSVGPRVRRVFV